MPPESQQVFDRIWLNIPPLEVSQEPGESTFGTMGLLAKIGMHAQIRDRTSKLSEGKMSWHMRKVLYSGFVTLDWWLTVCSADTSLADFNNQFALLPCLVFLILPVE